MPRHLLAIIVVAAAALSLDAKPIQKAPPVRTSEQCLAVLRKLEKEIDVKPLHARVKLRVALEHISKTADLLIGLDPDYFLWELGADAPDPWEEEVALPEPFTKVPVHRALRLILPQIAKGKAEFRIIPLGIEILPAALAEEFSTPPGPGPGGAGVIAFHERPLRDVLDELAFLSGHTINVDPRLGKQLDTPITAVFRTQLNLRDALVLATDMADLKVVNLSRSIFITQAKQAERIERDETDRQRLRDGLKPPPERLLPVSCGAPTEEAQVRPDSLERTLSIIHALNTPVEVSTLIEARKLKDALPVLAKLTGNELSFLIDPGLRFELGDDALPVAEHAVSVRKPTLVKRLEPVDGPPQPQRKVTLKLPSDYLLRQMLAHIRYHLSYVIRQGRIEIVAFHESQAEALLRYPVAGVFRGAALEDALEELADQSGLAVIVDPRIGARAKTPIRATFKNASLRDALTTTAESARLKCVWCASCVYVTTPERAKILNEREFKQ